MDQETIKKPDNSKITRLLWLDMEMTGLNPEKDRIVEIAAIVTDWGLDEFATFESGVGQDREELDRLFDACPFYKKYKENRKILTELSENSPPEAVVEQQFVEFIKKNCDTHYPVILAGNSIHQDRSFIKKWWPEIEQLLHYRMLDVTAWKLVFENYYDVKWKKNESHRALDDVRESIEELKLYRGHIS
jgi:oligoribonuclease